MALDHFLNNEARASRRFMLNKRSNASSALVQVQSLPRELVRGRSGVQIPSPFPVREETKSDELEVDANFDPQNRGYCEAYPDIGVPFFQTSANAILPSMAPLILKSVFSPDATASDYAVGVARDHVGAHRLFSAPVGQAIRFFSKTTKASDMGVSYKVTGVPVGFPIIVSLQIWDPVFIGGSWNTIDVAVVPSGHMPFRTFNSLTANTTNVLQSGLTSYIKIELIGPGPAVGALRNRRIMLEATLMSSGFSQGNIPPAATTANWMFAHDATLAWDTCSYATWPYLNGLPDLATIRNLGYELLCTYTGSRQLDGGKVAMALVPMEWSPTDTSPFAAVARVRHNKYSSALRDGAHGTWRFGTVSELNPTPPEATSLPFQKLVVGYERNNAENQSMRLRATGVFGVYSDSPIIGLAPFVPALSPLDLEFMTQYFSYAPACTENPTHEILKDVAKVMAKVGGGLAKAAGVSAKFIAQNPQVLAPLAMALGQPEVAAALAGSKGAKPTQKALPAKKLIERRK